MRLFVLCALLVAGAVLCDAASWAWLSGSSSINSAASYGTQGKATAAVQPGARDLAAADISATSTQAGVDRLYVYGGRGDKGQRWNNLMAWDSVLGQWSWVSGGQGGAEPPVYPPPGVTSGASDIPGARQSALYLQSPSEYFLLFGGDGVDEDGKTGFLADVWTWNPNQSPTRWLYRGGPRKINSPPQIDGLQNTPGGRSRHRAQFDREGRLWMFGGEARQASVAQAQLQNDLWRLDGSTFTWSLVEGSTRPGQATTYPAGGVKSGIGGYPGGRRSHAMWVDDADGTVWIYGGWGAARSTTPGLLNDLWRYNPESRTWRWESGSDKVDVPAVYPPLGTGTDTSNPGGREGAAFAMDSLNNLWLFGGRGVPTRGTVGVLNDLWRYDVPSRRWIWVSGRNLVNSAGTYGTQGQASANTLPGSRSNALMMFGARDRMYIFGGHGYGTSSTTAGALGDLWRFDLVERATGNATNAPSNTPPADFQRNLILAIVAGVIGGVVMVGVLVFLLVKVLREKPPEDPSYENL